MALPDLPPESPVSPGDAGPPEPPADDEPMERRAAPEDELLRIEQVHADLAEKARQAMQPIRTSAPPEEPTLTTGDLP